MGRFSQTFFSAAEITFRPRREHPVAFTLEFLSPIIVLLFFSILQLTILVVLDRYSPSDVPWDKYNAAPGNTVLPQPVQNAIEGLCTGPKGRIYPVSCFAFVPSGDADLDNAVRRSLASLDPSTAPVEFSSISEARARLMKWVGYVETPCAGCYRTSDIGYVVAAQTLYISGSSDPTHGLTVFTPDSAGLMNFNGQDAPTHAVVSEQFYGTTPENESQSQGEGEGRGVAWGASRVHAEVLREVSKLKSQLPIQPPHLPLTPVAGDYRTAGNVRLGTRQHTSQGGAPPASVADFFKDFPMRLVFLYILPAFAATFSISSVTDIAHGVNGAAAAAGLHPLGPWMIVCLGIIFYTILIVSGGLLAGLVFPGVFEPVLHSTTYDGVFGVTMTFLTTISAISQAIGVGCWMRGRAGALVLGAIIVILGPACGMIQQLIEPAWPAILFMLISPNSLMVLAPGPLSIVQQIRDIVVRASGQTVTRLTLTQIMHPNFPSNVLPASILEYIPENTLALARMVPAMMGLAIALPLIYLGLSYLGIATRSHDPSGPRDWRRARALLPRTRTSVKTPLMQTEAEPAVVENLLVTYKLSRGTEITCADRLIVTPRQTLLAAVNGVSVTFERGQITALLGMNGAGKSTLLRTILGVERPTGGCYRVLGADPAASPTTLLEVLPAIGYVPQYNTVGNFSCRLHCELLARVRGLPQETWAEEAQRCLQAVGLIRDGKEHAAGTSLSGGQKRRLMVAMAMVGRPALLILDEPSAGLSVDAKVDLDNAIREAARHSSVIITEHDLAEVDGLADTLVIMRDGKVVAEGTSLTLKEEYGSGYTLRVSLQAGCSRRMQARLILGLIHSVDREVELTAKSGRDLFFTLHDANLLAEIGRALENNRDQLAFASYSFDITTLDDVFLSLAAAPSTEPAPATTGLAQPTSTTYNELGDDFEPPQASDEAPAVAPLSAELSSMDVSSVNSSLQVQEVGWWRQVQLLIGANGRIGLRTGAVTSLAVAYFIICISVSIAFTCLIPVLDKLRDSFVRGNTLTPATGINYLTAMNHLFYKVDYVICPEGASPAGAASPCHYSTRTEADFDELATRLTVRLQNTHQPIKHDWADLETLLASTKEFIVPATTSFPVDRQTMPSTIMVFTGDTSADIYTTPPLLTNHTLKLPNQPLLEVLASTVLALCTEGYDGATLAGGARVLGPFWGLGSEKGATAGTAAAIVESYMYDSRIVAFLPIAMMGPFLGLLLVTMLNMGIICIPYCMADQRATGFAWMLKLLGERRGANLTAWLVSLQAPIALASSLFAVAICAAEMGVSKHSFCDWKDILGFSGLFFLGCVASSCNWVFLGGWVAYTRKSAIDVFKILPPSQYIVLICYFGIMIWSFLQLNTPLEAIRAQWGPCELVLGVMPLFYPIVFTARAVFLGNYGELFDNEFTRLSVCTVVQVVWSVLLGLALYAREEAEWGGISNPWLRKFLTFGGSTGSDAPQPSAADYRRAGVRETDLLTPSQTRHPRADESVDTETAAVENEGGSAVVCFEHARREFVGADGALVVALRDLCLQVKAGECLGLVGENGAGKTTALSLALKQSTPTSGHVTTRTRRTGYVPQHNAFSAQLTVGAHVRLFTSLSGIGTDRGMKLASICGLDDMMSRRPGQLSGGYKRRLQLALALITSTELLVADEVAAGVDIHAQRAITQLMDELKNAGTSLVITSHDMASVDRLATRVALLTKGRLRTIGTPDQLKQRYSQGLQVTVQLAPEATNDVAAAWLATVARCPVQEVVVMPALGGDCRFIVPDTNIRLLDMLEAISPAHRPQWVARAAAAPTSLQSVFLELETECTQLGLTNFISNSSN